MKPENSQLDLSTFLLYFLGWPPFFRVGKRVGFPPSLAAFWIAGSPSIFLQGS
jgi:hypothetical protein